MRYFIAIDFPEKIIEELLHIQQKVKKANLFDGKFVEAENLHLTLRFLGELDKGCSYGFDRLTTSAQKKTNIKKCAHSDASTALSTKGCAHPDASSTLSTKGCARPELVEGYEYRSELDNPIIIDGGNSFYKDSKRRASTLAKSNIFYLDCGTSGGIHGLKDGFCLMIGGNEDAFKKAEPIFETIAAKDGYALVGPSGAGHYVKMVHNGIEYALLQSYAEGFSILHASRQFPHLNLEQISGLWMHGSIIRSFLLELTHEIFKEKIDFNKIKGIIGESGTGRWAQEEANLLGLNTPALESALKTRKESQIKGDSFTMKLIALLRNKFGGHPVEKE